MALIRPRSSPGCRTRWKHPLKHALFEAYFTRGENPGDHDVLVAAAQQVGLDPKVAREVLSSGQFADHVRSLERQWYEAGISSVPAIIINGKYLISGGQPADAFERALRTIAAEAG